MGLVSNSVHADLTVSGQSFWCITALAIPTKAGTLSQHRVTSVVNRVANQCTRFDALDCANLREYFVFAA